MQAPQQLSAKLASHVISRTTLQTRILAAKIFCLVSSVLTSLVFFPGHFVVGVLGFCLLLYHLWNSRSVESSLLVALILLLLSLFYGGAPLFSIRFNRLLIEGPKEIALDRRSEVKTPHQEKEIRSFSDNITLSSHLPYDSFDSAQFIDELAEVLGVPQGSLRIRVVSVRTSRDGFDIVVQIFSSTRGTESVQKEAIRRSIALLRRVLNEKNSQLQKFRMTEIKEEPQQLDESWDMDGEEAFGGEAVIELIPGPRIILSGGGDICEGEEAVITFTMSPSWNGPWHVVYYHRADNGEITMLTIPRVETTPYHVRVTKGGVYQMREPPGMPKPRAETFLSFIASEDASRDKNNCKPESVDGEAIVRVHSVPRGDLSGGGTICEGDLANLTFSLVGNPPWSITYTDGVSQLTKDVEESPFVLQTGKAGKFKLLTVASHKDGGACLNRTESKTVEVAVNQRPKGHVFGGRCVGDDIILELSGQNPWEVTYQDCEKAKKITVAKSPYAIRAQDCSYTFDEIADQNCDGKVEGAPKTIRPLVPPRGRLSGGGSFFEGAAVELSVDLSGQPPWTIKYNDGRKDVVVQGIADSPFQFPANQEGKYRLLEVMDITQCPGFAEGTATVTRYQLPTAYLRGDPWGMCEGQSMQLQVHLTGTPPWTVAITDEKKERTESVSVSPFNFTASSPGIYRLLYVEDKYGNKVPLDESITVAATPLPTGEISGGGMICEGDTTELVFKLQGNPPWSIRYTDGEREITRDNIESSPLVIQTGKPGNYRLTRVSSKLSRITDIECENKQFSSKNVVTIKTKPPPTCTVRNSVCTGEDIKINCVGVAPWTLSYSMGREYSKVESSTSHFTVRANSSGTVRFFDLVDGTTCKGTVTPQQIEVQQVPKARLSGDGNLCEGDSVDLKVELEGSPPWQLAYSDGKDVTTVSDIRNSPYRMKVTDGVYTLVSVSDRNCAKGTVEGEARISKLKTPEATVEGGGTMCPYKGEEVELRFHFTGVPPWTFTYTDGVRRHTESDIYSSPFIKHVHTNGTYRVVEVTDGNRCPGIPGPEEATVLVYPKPHIRIGGGGTICKGDDSEITIEADRYGTGPPFSVTYSDGETETTVTGIMSFPHNIKTGKAGTYHLTGVSDSKCRYPPYKRAQTGDN